MRKPQRGKKGASIPGRKRESKTRVESDTEGTTADTRDPDFREVEFDLNAWERLGWGWGGERTSFTKGKRLLLSLKNEVSWIFWVWDLHLCYLLGLENPKLRNSSQCFWVGSTQGLAEVNTDPFWNSATCNSADYELSDVSRVQKHYQGNEPPWMRVTLVN